MYVKYIDLSDIIYEKMIFVLKVKEYIRWFDNKFRFNLSVCIDVIIMMIYCFYI